MVTLSCWCWNKVAAESSIALGKSHHRRCNVREHIAEDIVIFFRFVMQIVAAGAEIERPGEIRRNTKFLTQLPRMFLRKILKDQPIRATHLRIENTRVTRSNPESKTGCRPKPVVIFRRKQKIVTETGLRRESQVWRYCIIRIQFDDIVLCAVGGWSPEFDHTQIVGLGLAGVGVDSVASAYGSRTP